ncbi:MAG: condensation domain-containing protein [Marinifilaceae bacterium]
MLHVLKKIDGLNSSQQDKLFSLLGQKGIDLKGQMILEYPFCNVEKREYYNVSSSQFRVFIANQLDLSSTAFNNQLVFVLTGDVNLKKMNEALTALVSNHETLRTSFFELKGSVYQKIHKPSDFSITEINNVNTSIESVIQDFVEPFDLEVAPLLRVGVCKLSEAKYLLIFDIHHIISDAESLILLTNEFVDLYKGKKIKAYHYQYRDYSHWEKEINKRFLFRLQKKFWNNLYAKNENYEFPFGNPIVSKDYVGNVFEFSFDADEKLIIDKSVKEMGITHFMFLIGAFALTISRETLKNDVVIGTPVAGRRKKEFEGIMGIFVNMLSIKIQVNKEGKIVEFYKKLKRVVLKCFENQEYPYDRLVGDVNKGNALINIVFAFQNAGGRLKKREREASEEFDILPYKYFGKTSKFPLLLEAWEEERKIGLRFEYSPHIFSENEIQKIAETYQKIVSELINNLKLRIDELAPLKKVDSLASKVHQSDLDDFDF